MAQSLYLQPQTSDPVLPVCPKNYRIVSTSFEKEEANVLSQLFQVWRISLTRPWRNTDQLEVYEWNPRVEPRVHFIILEFLQNEADSLERYFKTPPEEMDLTRRNS